MKGVPYKSLAKFVVTEITKCEDKEIICKFVSEMCKLGRLKKGYKIPKIIKESENYEKDNN